MLSNQGQDLYAALICCGFSFLTKVVTYTDGTEYRMIGLKIQNYDTESKQLKQQYVSYLLTDETYCVRNSPYMMLTKSEFNKIDGEKFNSKQTIDNHYVGLIYVQDIKKRINAIKDFKDFEMENLVKYLIDLNI